MNWWEIVLNVLIGGALFWIGAGFMGIVAFALFDFIEEASDGWDLPGTLIASLAFGPLFLPVLVMAEFSEYWAMWLAAPPKRRLKKKHKDFFV